MRLDRRSRSVAKALSDVERAYRTLSARGDDLLAVAHRAHDEAVEAHRAALAHEMADRYFLRDILALRDALANVALGALPNAIEGLRTLPAALIDWLVATLDVVPHLECGQRLEVPKSRLADFVLEGEEPATELVLVKLVVVRPGWKRRGSVLVRPTVEWAGR
ncbi:MAG: hypothetical protein HYU51_05025 [Candidatus Rokubacteria bacterium]|nr:hypothetical protein [Candidatus Rokubacteria bacterium]